MRSMFEFVIAALVLTAGISFAGDGPPAWAYGIPPGTPLAGNPPAAPAAGGGAGQAPQAPTDTSLKHISGSSLEFTRAQISDGFAPADWFPGDHPPEPDIVAHGKKPVARACALCHNHNGKGRPEDAGIAGLPVSYFIQQMHDFRNGDRKSAEPRKTNTDGMIDIAKALTEDEIKAAAEYFGSMKWTPWIKVVETDLVPKTRNVRGLFLALEGGEKEPLGQRIIEVPENTEATEILHNPRSGFIAYVPVGSVKKGEALVTTRGGKTTQCGVCHGADLNGFGPVPGIAGRSPSYLMRQMYDIQQGTRMGTGAALMKPVVTRLSEGDMLDIVAYASSLLP
jgi:cytochrome c553